ncbi:MAG: helix-turn-helix domain-containing protein [Allosphingosinicella sp.]
MALGWKRGGFTPAKKAACLEALARGASVEEAAREAGISPTTFYRHEKKDPEFQSLCRAARARSGGTASLETLAWERGVTGVEEEVVQGGKVVGKRRKRSDAVFKMLLEGGDSGPHGPQIKALKARIEKELRPKIEAEVRAELRQKNRIDGPALRKEFDRLLSDFNRRMGGDG